MRFSVVPGTASTDLLCPIRALISDLDGTLVAGNRPQRGLIPFLDFLRRREIAFTVVTNNTVRTPEEYSARLAALGAGVPADQILTASVATAEYLRSVFPPPASVFVVEESGLKTALLVPVEDGLAPEAGVLLAAIAAGAGVAPTIIGKPERPLLELALRRMGSTPAETAILGDRLDTDILGGRRLGLTTILVTTGVDDAAAIRARGIVPDLVVDGLEELTALWTQSKPACPR